MENAFETRISYKSVTTRSQTTLRRRLSLSCNSRWQAEIQVVARHREEGKKLGFPVIVLYLRPHIPPQIGGPSWRSRLIFSFGTPVRFPFFKSLSRPRISYSDILSLSHEISPVSCLRFPHPSLIHNASKATPDKHGCAATRRLKCSRKPIV